MKSLIAIVVTLLIVQRGSDVVAPVATASVSIVGLVLAHLAAKKQASTATQQFEDLRLDAAAARADLALASNRELKLELYEEIDNAARTLARWADIQNGPMPVNKGVHKGSHVAELAEGGILSGDEYGESRPRLPTKLLRASWQVGDMVDHLRSLGGQCNSTPWPE